MGSRLQCAAIDATEARKHRAAGLRDGQIAKQRDGAVLPTHTDFRASDRITLLSRPRDARKLTYPQNPNGLRCAVLPAVVK